MQTLDSLPGYPALLKRVDELSTSYPAAVSDVQIVGGRYYSLRRPQGAQSPKLYVRDGLKGDDRLLIDPEKLSTGTQAHLSIDGYRPSPDGHYIAYQLAAGGSEESVLHIYDAQAGKDLPETADRADGDAFWRADSRSFFYLRGQKMEPGMPQTAEEENGRTYLHMLGRSFDDDPPILGRGVSRCDRDDAGRGCRNLHYAGFTLCNRLRFPGHRPAPSRVCGAGRRHSRRQGRLARDRPEL